LRIYYDSGGKGKGDSMNFKLAGKLKGKELFFIYILIVAVVGVMSDRFLSMENITNILRNTAIGGILALGLTMVMVNGDFDLSFGGAVSLLNLIGLILLDKGLNLYAMFALLILGGIAWELINAFLVIRLRMHAFIATIATLTISKGLIFWITKGSTFYGAYPENLTFLGRHNFFDILPANTLIFIALAVFVFFLLNRSKFGRHLYAIGGNPQAAAYVGIRVNRTRVISYILSGLCVGVATVTLSSKLATAPSTAGDGYQMTVISAAFLGAAAFKVGAVNVSGSILAIFILTTIENALIMLSVPFYFQFIVQGLILIGAVTFVSRKSKKAFGPAIY
jgi:ribose/xylose/arabinose/galactoside ABC-type transport system permease subunit